MAASAPKDFSAIWDNTLQPYAQAWRFIHAPLELRRVR